MSTTQTKKTTALRQFIAHLHRGGDYAFWWTEEGLRSFWWEVERPSPIPSGRLNVYVGVHPVGAIPSTNAQDEKKPPEAVRSRIDLITAINCLFAEFDAKDFDGDKAAILPHIDALTEPPSVIVDSGGGYHCYWLLAKPFVLATDEDRDRAKRMQAAWVALVGGDGGAKDLARVLRVPGTTNYKKKYAPDFPKVAFVKVGLGLTYSLDDLDKLLPPQQERQRHTTHDDNGRTGKDAYYDAALAGELSSVAGANEGRRNAQLNSSAYSLGQLLGAGLGDRGEVERKLLAVALGIGLGEREALATIRSGLEAGLKDPRHIKDKRQTRQRPAPSPTEDTGGDALGYLLTETADDEGNAQCLKRLHAGGFLWCDAYGWMTNNGRFWDKSIAEPRLDRAVIHTLKTRRLAAVEADREAIIKRTAGTANNVRNTKHQFKSIVAVTVGDFDQSPDHINTLNGVLDLRTGQLVTHEPGQRFTYCLPVGYDPDADKTAWLDFLGEATGLRVVTKYLQECMGYSLTGWTAEEVLFFISGPPRSGKGTFTETLLYTMGREPLATEVDFVTFTMRRDQDAQNFDLAPLKPCRFVAASESRRGQRLNAEKVKSITGGNLIRCAFKHRDHFTYRPQFKVWLSSNWPVNADPDDDALWSRLRVIKFPNSHLGKEDKSLKRRLRQPENLAGVLAWAVEGARRWYDRGNVGLIAPQLVKDATQAARDEQDFIAQWLAECVEKTDDPDHFVPNEAVYQSYKSWCTAVGVTPKGARNLTMSLKRKGYQAGVQKWHKGKNMRGCTGAQFKADMPSDSEPEPIGF